MTTLEDARAEWIATTAGMLAHVSDHRCNVASCTTARRYEKGVTRAKRRMDRLEARA